MNKVSPEITVKVDGEDRDIFMSFGLLDTLSRLIGDPSNVAQVHIDLDLRKGVLEALLAERKKSGKVINEVDIEETEISIEDAEKLVEWAASHVLNFFIRSLSKVSEMTKKSEKEIKALVSTFPGLSNSASQTQSVGPQE